MKKRLEAYLEWLSRNFEPLLVIVFGSYVTGEWTEKSDLDVVVVSRKLSSDVGENFIVLKQTGIDPIGYNPESFIQEIQRPNLLVLDALEYGRVVVSDDSYLKEVMAVFDEVKRKFGLRWTGKTWTWTARE